MDSPLKDPETFREALKIAAGWGGTEEQHDIIKAALEEGAKDSEERERRRKIDPSSLNETFTV